MQSSSSPLLLHICVYPPSPHSPVHPHTYVSRGRGVVVNIASTTSDHPLQLISTYSATKVLHLCGFKHNFWQQAVDFLHPPSCRDLIAISQMLCVKSIAQRESLYRWVWVSEQIMNLNLIGNTSLPLSSFLSPPSVPSIFPIYNISFISLPFPHPGCQARVCCHGIEWYSKDLKVDSRSRHLHSCCCCYHWYPTYHIWLLLPCTTGRYGFVAMVCNR